MPTVKVGDTVECLNLLLVITLTFAKVLCLPFYLVILSKK